jgi:uncharacterized RDD family membrane protein YckC
MNFKNYRPAGGGERLLVLMGNMFLCGSAAGGLISGGKYCGLTEEESLVFYTLSLIGAVIVFSLYPESPCKRMLQLKVLSSEKNEIPFKLRIFRVSPYLFLLLILLLPLLLPAGWNEHAVVTAVFSMAHILNVFFIFANGLCVFFHPEKKSLMDMKLGTQVMKPPPTPDHLKIRLFGRKVI